MASTSIAPIASRPLPIDRGSLPARPKPAVEKPAFGAEFWSSMRTLGGRHTGVATDVVPLRDGKQALQARLDLIKSARSTVLCSLYHINPDASGFAFMDALIERAKAGKGVLLKLDEMPQAVSAGKFPKAEREKLEKKLKELEAHGGVVAYNSTGHRAQRKFGTGDHYKALVVDGETAIFGGRNIGDYYFKTWTDFDVQMKGTLVSQIAQEAIKNVAKAAPLGIGTTAAHERFMAMLHRVAKDAAEARDKNGMAKKPGHEAQLIAWDPSYDKGPNPITQALVEMFKRARKSIVLSSNYVNGSTELREALILAAKEHHVKVTIVTSSLEVSALSTLPYFNAERWYDELQDAGVNIRETTRFEHGKMFLIDDEIGAFGSYNVEHPADNMLAEGLVVTKDKTFVDMVRKNLKDTIDNRTKPYVPLKRGFFESIGAFFARIVARIAEPFI